MGLICLSLTEITHLLFPKLLFLRSQSLFRLIITFVLRFAHVVAVTPHAPKVRSNDPQRPSFLSSPVGVRRGAARV